MDGSNAATGAYSEEHTVADVHRVHGTNPAEYEILLGSGKGKSFVPETLAHAFGVDPTPNAAPQFADAIAKLSGSTLSVADYFETTDNLVTGTVFPAAFADYQILPDTPLVPMPFFGSFDQIHLLQPFANKWCSIVVNDVTPPGYQLLLIADSDRSAAPDAGVTVSLVPGQTSSWVWLGTIEQQVATSGAINYGADPTVWSSKTAVHELAHQWKTDAIFNLQDHCLATMKAYNSTTEYCLLAVDDPQGSETQRADGKAFFHMLPLPNGGYHSEYFQIRDHADPFVP